MDIDYADIEEYAEIIEAYESGITSADALYDYFGGLYDMVACNAVVMKMSR